MQPKATSQEATALTAARRGPPDDLDFRPEAHRMIARAIVDLRTFQYACSRHVHDAIEIRFSRVDRRARAGRSRAGKLTRPDCRRLSSRYGCRHAGGGSSTRAKELGVALCECGDAAGVSGIQNWMSSPGIRMESSG
jgi:hypothetical protein